MKYINLIFLFITLFGLSQKDFIGKPIRFTYVEVAQNDYPKELTYNEAIKITKSVGNGWRLPTKEELLKMYEKKDFIKGFEWGAYYLTDEVYGKNLVYAVEFADGKLDKWWKFLNGSEIHYNVRLIRTIKK